MSIISFLTNVFRIRRKKREDIVMQGITRSMQVAGQARTGKQGQPLKAPDNALLLSFFRNEDTEQIPHRHEDVVTFTDELMERYHDFIQWIFPTMRPSMMRPETPIIDGHFAEQLCADECAMKNFCKSCRRYLNYMNFDCEGDCRITDFTGELPFYELPAHNFMRITRMLNSLRQTGHQRCSRAVYEKMLEVMQRAPQDKMPSEKTLQYWKATQQHFAGHNGERSQSK